MAAVVLRRIFAPLLLLLLSPYASGLAFGDDPILLWGVAGGVEDLTPAGVCSASNEVSSVTGGSGHRLSVIHRHGPCSPTSAGSKAAPAGHHIEIRLARDSLRAASLHKMTTASGARASPEEVAVGASNAVTLPAQSGNMVGSGDYVVTVGFGTPKADQIVIFDTGSNLCWIQCKPCAGTCYQQKNPIFDPAASASYHNISCPSHACETNVHADSCSAGTCHYSILYGDGSFTNGVLAVEQMALLPSVVLPSFAFGCGEDNQGLFDGVSGIIGLARSASSLVSQASKRLGNVFSYCLPVKSSNTGHLTIGSRTAHSEAVYTKMKADSRAPSLYFIDLIGISVGGNRLPIKPKVFSAGGTIIDSGTVITRLPLSAYSELRSAFRRDMAKYRQADPVSLLDTCYDFSGVKGISYPQITLHFDGADVTLDLPGILISIDVGSVACLAFAGNESPSDIGILGNVQQRGIEVIYDIAAQKIGFAPRACK